MNITPDWITELKENEIFVFGSNVAGRHGKGSAKLAMKWGAKYGQGFGIQGRTFAIPTMDAKIRNKLSITKIETYVQRFIEFAANHPELKFFVTEIGCGLAGWTSKDIAPLFWGCDKMTNVYLPQKFWKVLQHKSESPKNTAYFDGEDGF